MLFIVLLILSKKLYSLLFCLSRPLINQCRLCKQEVVRQKPFLIFFFFFLLVFIVMQHFQRFLYKCVLLFWKVAFIRGKGVEMEISSPELYQISMFVTSFEKLVLICEPLTSWSEYSNWGDGRGAQGWELKFPDKDK